jgi:hypothetical protein
MKLILVCGLALGALGSVASADAPAKPKTLVGAPAKSLILALKLSGIKPTRAKDKWTFKAATIACHSVDAGEDGLRSFDCQADKLKLADAAAMILHEALGAAGLDVDAGMSQTHVKAYALQCDDDQGATGGMDKIYSCTFSAAPAK